MMSERRVLIVDKMHRSICSLLENIGWEADYRPSIQREEILSIIGEYEGLIVRSKTPIDKEVIAKAEKLIFLARAGAGLDLLDRKALEERNVVLINAPEGNRNAVGEHTLGLLLSLMHNINRSSIQVKQGIWKREANRGFELGGKTVGIYGYGFMGSAFAEKLTSFGCRVIAFDRFKEDFGHRAVNEVSLSHFEEETEILSIHLPLTSETRMRFTAEYLRKYPNLKYIINTSRGELLSMKGVLELLEEGKLLGAALDVLENEKLDQLSEDQKQVFDALAQRDNVILTPHIAGWTYESYERINQVIVKKMVELGMGNNLASASKK
jgi:D-3-phosphoglycerate dehydrogenase